MNYAADTSPTRPKKLLDQMADHIRVRHLALSTERSYVGWARRFILFHNKRHPREMGVPEVTRCAHDRNFAARRRARPATEAGPRFTPKALHNIAQGKRSAALGIQQTH